MPSYTIAVSLAHNPTGAGLTVVEHRYRAVGMTGIQKVMHCHLLETFGPATPYGVISERIAELLDSVSLRGNTRVTVAVTEAQRVPSRGAFGRIAGVRPNPVMFDGNGLRRGLVAVQVALQSGGLAFAPGVPMAERLTAELLALSAHEPLEAGVQPGSLGLALLAAVWWAGPGRERQLPDDYRRDKITPLDLRVAPVETLITASQWRAP